MTKTSTKHRIRLYMSQGGSCWYCSRPMREVRIGTIRDFCDRLGVDKLTKRQLRYHQCTIEHLNRKADGGANSMANYVGACMRCNSMRGDIPPDRWKEMMQRNDPIKEAETARQGTALHSKV